MLPMRPLPNLPNSLLALMAVYFVTSLGHFAHNAEFICEYPNLPAWLTRAKVYTSWVAITSVGALGYFLIRKCFVSAGLVFIASYAALGFDGLGHYAVAPMALHSFGANLTILSEVAAAAILLPAALFLLARQVSQRSHRGADA